MNPLSLPCQQEDFETDLNGERVQIFTLKNRNGITCQITNFGGRILSLFTPDRNGEFSDIVLGYNTLEEFLINEEAYFGAIIGRVANRIENASFTLSGQTFYLEPNKGPHHIHGGRVGFHHKVWRVVKSDSQTLELEIDSEHLEGGYPGHLSVKVKYSLLDSDALRIKFEAICDKASPVSLTNHTYFNLNGAGNGTIENHVLQIQSSKYTPTDEDQIPTGTIESVVGTPFDFRTLKPIGVEINQGNSQLNFADGFDQNFAIEGIGFRKAATISAPLSGRVLEVFTDAPGMQFYSGNGLDGSLLGKNKKSYLYRSAFCLETQEFPNAVNCPEFPNSIFSSDRPYHHICEYRFGTD